MLKTSIRDRCIGKYSVVYTRYMWQFALKKRKTPEVLCVRLVLFFLLHVTPSNASFIGCAKTSYFCTLQVHGSLLYIMISRFWDWAFCVKSSGHTVPDTFDNWYTCCYYCAAVWNAFILCAHSTDVFLWFTWQLLTMLINLCKTVERKEKRE